MGFSSEAKRVAESVVGGSERALAMRKWAKDAVTAKRVAGGAAGALAIGGYMHRRGPAANKMGRGRPTGPYGY